MSALGVEEDSQYHDDAPVHTPQGDRGPARTRRSQAPAQDHLADDGPQDLVRERGVGAARPSGHEHEYVLDVRGLAIRGVKKNTGFGLVNVSAAAGVI
jgi:hypothetical protein